jgi:hypothetical protein
VTTPSAGKQRPIKSSKNDADIEKPPINEPQLVPQALFSEKHMVQRLDVNRNKFARGDLTSRRATRRHGAPGISSGQSGPSCSGPPRGACSRSGSACGAGRLDPARHVGWTAYSTCTCFSGASNEARAARRRANTSEPGRGEKTACGAYVPRAGGDEAVDFLALRVHEAVAGCALHDVIQ